MSARKVAPEPVDPADQDVATDAGWNVHEWSPASRLTARAEHLAALMALATATEDALDVLSAPDRYSVLDLVVSLAIEINDCVSKVTISDRAEGGAA